MNAPALLPPPVPLPCRICESPTYRLCGGCMQARYCCQEHAQLDWTSHEAQCYRLPAPPSTTPASALPCIPPTTPALPSTAIRVRAFLFKPDEQCERFIDVFFNLCLPPERPSPVPFLQEYFPVNAGAGSLRSKIIWEGGTAERLRYPLQVWYCAEAVARGTPVNRPILRLAGGRHTSLCGTVVALRFSGTRCIDYCDIKDLDLTRLGPWFAKF
ncbi:hypothetical protein OH77DRAFT_1465914 [Trametes cingulata]|nr:hypothetical protein OH77DRAFT_1465914 [Trametes cingulata]